MTNHVAHLDKENQTNKMVNGSLTAVLERYKERVTIFEQRLNVDLNKRKKLIDSQMNDLIRDKYAKLTAFWQEIDTLKETLSNLVKENESLSKTLTVFKTESKEKESKYIDKEIVLEKQSKELENIISLGYQNPFHLKKAQRIQPTLYDGSVIAKEHAVIFLFDDEETLILEEESRSKMLDKQNDLILIEKKIKISLIDYSKLNKIKEDFGKRFVTKKELPAEQAFWLKHSSFSKTLVTSHTPVRIEAPSELPKRTTSDAITAGAWGFEHTKACFVTEIILFLKVLKDTFNAFDKTLLDEITEVQTIFKQMEAAVDQSQRPIGRNRKDTVVKQKEHCDSLIAQINAKSVENSDLNAQLQEKVFSEIGYSWKPTSKTFTIVGNKCSLTRITSTRVVPTKETSTKSVATPTQGILVYSKKPKETRSVGSSSKVKIVESKTSNSKEPKPSWGSTVSDVPFFLWYLDSSCSKNMTSNHSQLINFVSKFLGTVRFGNDHIAKIKGYKDYQMGNVTIS
ncbi:hypothetical protein Tco_1164957 [Tanacetum coccineum]